MALYMSGMLQNGEDYPIYFKIEQINTLFETKSCQQFNGKNGPSCDLYEILIKVLAKQMISCNHRSGFWDELKDKKLQAYEKLQEELFNVNLLHQVKDINIDHQIANINSFIQSYEWKIPHAIQMWGKNDKFKGLLVQMHGYFVNGLKDDLENLKKNYLEAEKSLSELFCL